MANGSMTLEQTVSVLLQLNKNATLTPSMLAIKTKLISNILLANDVNDIPLLEDMSNALLANGTIL